MDALIGLFVGAFIGTNFGFIIAGLMGVADDVEDLPY